MGQRAINLTFMKCNTIFFCFLVLIAFVVDAQKVIPKNLSEKQYFYYDFNKTKIESEGYYYVDDLGATSLRHGRWKFYNRQGDVQEVRNYFKNELHGETQVYFSNGRKKSVGYFKNNLQDSVYMEWDERGTLRQKGVFIAGAPCDKWEYYYMDGSPQLFEEIIYGVSNVTSFWLPDSLHTQTVINGTGEVVVYHPNGALKEWYSYQNGLKNGPFEEGSINGYFLLKGSFVNNKPHGQWNYYYYTGDIEKISNYENGLLNGPYSYYYDNGQINVTGSYLNNLKTGEWIWYTNKGIIDMMGSFENGKQHGQWIYNFPDGQLSYCASYQNDLKHGFWEYYYTNGAKFKQGSFENDKKNGEWKTWYENGLLLMQGDYKNDLEEGVWENYWDNGQLKNKTTFSLGKRNGDWESYYKNGIVKTTGQYQTELKTGKWMEYFDNGQLKDVEQYKVINIKSKIKYGPMQNRTNSESVQHGKFISYSQKDFQKTLEGVYKKGKKQGEWIAYHPGGVNPAVISNYKDGKLHGPMIAYSFRENRKTSEVNYKNGLQHGKVKIYNERGELIKEEEYNNGVKVINGAGFAPK